MVAPPIVNTFPLSSYTFGTKDPKMEKDTSVADRLARMKIKCACLLPLLRSCFLFVFCAVDLWLETSYSTENSLIFLHLSFVRF